MSRWYYDDEERWERITAANEEAARDRYEEKRDAQLEAEHEEERCNPVTCVYCISEREQAEEDSK